MTFSRSAHPHPRGFFLRRRPGAHRNLVKASVCALRLCPACAPGLVGDVEAGGVERCRVASGGQGWPGRSPERRLCALRLSSSWLSSRLLGKSAPLSRIAKSVRTPVCKPILNEPGGDRRDAG